MNTKINYYTLSVFQTFTLIILLTSSLAANDGGAGLGALIILLGLIGFFALAVLFRLFVKNNALIYVSLLLIAFFFYNGMDYDKKDRFEIKAWHMFQAANNYGVYEGNRTVKGTENLNIIYMSNSSSEAPYFLDEI